MGNSAVKAYHLLSCMKNDKSVNVKPSIRQEISLPEHCLSLDVPVVPLLTTNTELLHRGEEFRPRIQRPPEHLTFKEHNSSLAVLSSVAAARRRAGDEPGSTAGKEGTAYGGYLSGLNETIPWPICTMPVPSGWPDEMDPNDPIYDYALGVLNRMKYKPGNIQYLCSLKSPTHGSAMYRFHLPKTTQYGGVETIIY